MRFVMKYAMIGPRMSRAWQRVDDALDRELEVRRDDVRARGGPQDCVERDAGGTDSGAGRGVARAVSDVVLALVAGDPRLDEGVDGDERR